MSSGYVFRHLVLVVMVAAATACQTEKAPATTTSSTAVSGQPAEPLPAPEFETRLPEAVRRALLERFTGDFDQMIRRRIIRIGVPPNRTLYFVDKGVQRGVVYDYGLSIEGRINARLRRRAAKVQVFFVPMPREKLLPSLIDGAVDLVAGSITITPERQVAVDFTDPTRTNVDQIVVMSPGSAALRSLEDLSNRRIFVRHSSAYRNSLEALNNQLRASGKAPAIIEIAPEHLEDDDLLEMVNSGLIPAVVVDDYQATFWKKVFPNLVLQEKIAVHSGGSLGIAVRKNNPQLRIALNRFMGNYGLGTAFGKSVERKYLVDTTYVKSAASDAERRKFLAVVQLFRKYAERYNMDFLLMAAQGYQESRLDQSARSPVGAIGIMQLMPTTGSEMNVGDITKLEPNIHAGVKFLHNVMEANFKDEPMDTLNKGLFTFAAYNAGPGKVHQLRREAEKRGLDSNAWFGNVEEIASERLGRETVTYVSNIYKYYVAYRLVVEESERRTATKEALKTAEGERGRH